MNNLNITYITKRLNLKNFTYGKNDDKEFCNILYNKNLKNYIEPIYIYLNLNYKNDGIKGETFILSQNGNGLILEKITNNDLINNEIFIFIDIELLNQILKKYKFI